MQTGMGAVTGMGVPTLNQRCFTNAYFCLPAMFRLINVQLAPRILLLKTDSIKYIFYFFINVKLHFRIASLTPCNSSRLIIWI